MKRSSIVEIIFVMMLFTLFVGCSFALTLFEANGYQNIVEQNTRQNDAILPLDYINMKLKQASDGAAVSIEEEDGETHLLIVERIDDKEFYTYIYIRENQLYELFSVRKGLNIESGTRLMPARSLSMHKHDGVFEFSTIDESEQLRTLRVVLR